MRLISFTTHKIDLIIITQKFTSTITNTNGKQMQTNHASVFIHPCPCRREHPRRPCSWPRLAVPHSPRDARRRLLASPWRWASPPSAPGRIWRRRLLAARPGGRTCQRLGRPRGDDRTQASPACTRPRRCRVAARPRLHQAARRQRRVAGPRLRLWCFTGSHPHLGGREEVGGGREEEEVAWRCRER